LACSRPAWAAITRWRAMRASGLFVLGRTRGRVRASRARRRGSRWRGGGDGQKDGGGGLHFAQQLPPLPSFAQDDLQGTESCEGRLEQVEPDERGEPKPVRAVVMGEDQAEEDEAAGEAANDHFHSEEEPVRHRQPGDAPEAERPANQRSPIRSIFASVRAAPGREGCGPLPSRVGGERGVRGRRVCAGVTGSQGS
jgi:hypothetical protein